MTFSDQAESNTYYLLLYLERKWNVSELMILTKTRQIFFNNKNSLLQKTNFNDFSSSSLCNL
jgi:hypothetical protein